MSLPAFDLLQPASIQETLQLLDRMPKTTPIAGGTSLLVDLRSGRGSAHTMIDLSRVSDLQEITVTDTELCVGAMATISDLLNHLSVRDEAPLLHAACERFANPLIRNRATIGGNVAYASPAADTAPPLLAMEAYVELRSVRGKRLIPVDEFFLGVRKTARRKDELLTAIRIPRLPKALSTSYRKLGLRKADAISVVSVAAAAFPHRDGGIETRIALGAVSPIPQRARAAEHVLAQRGWTAEAFEAAAQGAAEACSPIDDLRGSASYRRRIVRVLVRRALTELAREAGSDHA